MGCGVLTVKVVRLELRVSVTEKTGKLGFEGAKDVAIGSEIIIYVNEKILALPAGVVKIKPAIIESN